MTSKIATNIRYFREQKNWTQQQLAKKLNVSRSMVAKWENESSMPDLNTLVSISNIFSISLDQLVGKNLSDELILREFERVYALDVKNDEDDHQLVSAIDLLKKNKGLLHDITSLSQMPIRKQKAVLQIVQKAIQEINRI